jgi:hypothetical protein
MSNVSRFSMARVVVLLQATKRRHGPVACLSCVIPLLALFAGCASHGSPKASGGSEEAYTHSGIETHDAESEDSAADTQLNQKVNELAGALSDRVYRGEVWQGPVFIYEDPTVPLWYRHAAFELALLSAEGVEVLLNRAGDTDLYRDPELRISIYMALSLWVGSDQPSPEVSPYELSELLPMWRSMLEQTDHDDATERLRRFEEGRFLFLRKMVEREDYISPDWSGPIYRDDPLTRTRHRDAVFELATLGRKGFGKLLADYHEFSFTARASIHIAMRQLTGTLPFPATSDEATVAAQLEDWQHWLKNATDTDINEGMSRLRKFERSTRHH